MTTLTNLTAAASLALCVGCTERKLEHRFERPPELESIWMGTNTTVVETILTFSNICLVLIEPTEVVGYNIFRWTDWYQDTNGLLKRSPIWVPLKTNNLEATWRLRRNPVIAPSPSANDVQFLTLPTNLYVTNTWLIPTTTNIIVNPPPWGGTFTPNNATEKP